MIAITFAVPHESHGLRSVMESGKQIGPRDWLTGKVAGQKVIIAHTGIGTAAAEECVAALLSEHHPRWLLSSGYAGALDPAIPHGELFLATNFSSPALLSRSTARRGMLTTQSRAAETADEKATLARETRAQAVDMEASAIARVCAARNVPMLSLRAISDTATAQIPVPLHITYDLARQRPRIAALLAFLARNPSRVLPFARFVRGLTPARAAMTAEIVAILNSEPRD